MSENEAQKKPELLLQIQYQNKHMLFAFWTCVPLLVIGLFSGCRYSFIGQDFGKAVEYI